MAVFKSAISFNKGVVQHVPHTEIAFECYSLVKSYCNVPFKTKKCLLVCGCSDRASNVADLDFGASHRSIAAASVEIPIQLANSGINGFRRVMWNILMDLGDLNTNSREDSYPQYVNGSHEPWVESRNESYFQRNKSTSRNSSIMFIKSLSVRLETIAFAVFDAISQIRVLSHWKNSYLWYSGVFYDETGRGAAWCFQTNHCSCYSIIMTGTLFGIIVKIHSMNSTLSYWFTKGMMLWDATVRICSNLKRGVYICLTKSVDLTFIITLQISTSQQGNARPYVAGIIRTLLDTENFRFLA